MEILHLHTEKGGRFYLNEADGSISELIYRMAGPYKMIIDHTEVSESHEGKGLGKQLVSSAVDYAREHHIKIEPLCFFAKSLFNKVKEFQDVLA